MNPTWTQPVYDKLIEAGKFSVFGIVPSAIQAPVATVHLLISAVALAAIQIVRFTASRFISEETKKKLADGDTIFIVHTVVAAAMLGSSILNILSLTYFNNRCF